MSCCAGGCQQGAGEGGCCPTVSRWCRGRKGEPQPEVAQIVLRFVAALHYCWVECAMQDEAALRPESGSAFCQLCLLPPCFALVVSAALRSLQPPPCSPNHKWGLVDNLC